VRRLRAQCGRGCEQGVVVGAVYALSSGVIQEAALSGGVRSRRSGAAATPRMTSGSVMSLGRTHAHDL
jgi:hypothetical protein